MDYTLLVFFNQALAHPVLDWVMVGLTYGFWLLPVLGMGLVVAGQGQVEPYRRRVGLAVLAVLAASLAATLTFQFLGLRPRPEGVRLVLPTPGFPSYPSGHAVGAFGVAVVVALSYRRSAWAWAGLLVAALMSLSRVYLGLHYPSDIVGGAILGAGLGAGCYGLVAAPQTNPRRVAWRWLIWPQISLVLLATHMAYMDLQPNYLLGWPMADKVLHFLLFGAIAFWLNLWLEGRTLQVHFRPGGKAWAIPLAVLIPLAFAVSEECLQAFSATRSASLGDALSDLAGMVFFWRVSSWGG